MEAQVRSGLVSGGPPLVRLYFRVYRRLACALLGCTVIAGVLAPALTLATGALASSVQSGRSVWLFLALICGLFAIQRLIGPVEEQVAAALARRVDESLTERMMSAVAAPAGLAHVEDPAVLDSIAKAQGALTGVTPGGAATRFGWVWTQRIQSVLSLAIVAGWHWWAAVVLGVSSVVTFLVSRWHWHQVTQVMYGRTDQLRRAYYLRALALTATIAKETRVFGLASWLVDHYRAGW